jgi:LytR cell envelope-related transcriptional attenuator
VAAVGSASARAEGYRRRRPMHALLLVVVLSATAVLVWTSVLHQTAGGCQDAAAPSAALGSSQRLPANGLDGVMPAPPQFSRVQVLNANGVRGEATMVDGTLAQLGFAPTTRPANDPQFPDFNLHCYGELRFGAAGQAAARTLSLAVPCAALVRDDRPDATVDLALGTKFLAVSPNSAARRVLLDLAGLGRPALAESSVRGGLAAQPDLPPGSEAQPQPAVPVVNPDLIRQARQVKC